MLRAFLAGAGWASCESVRWVFCSGEALSLELVKQFFATGARARLENLYGPTEAAVDVSFWNAQDHERAGAVLIGEPIANIRLHVVDERMRLQPIGAPGELVIAGVGLARGYFDKPALTAAAFVS
jgi:non-ribosomal peptide synthetase component F